MKKTLLMIALFAGLGTANAQTSAGRLFIGGDVLGFTNTSGTREGTTKVDRPSVTSFGIQPTIGYCLTDNWAIGAKLGFLNVSTNNNGYLTTPTTFKTSTNTITISPFVRYNMAMAEKFAFFVDGGINYSMSTTAYTETPTPGGGQDTDTKSNSFGVSVGPGFLWFVRDNIAIQGSIRTMLSFNKTTDTDNDKDKTKTTTNTLALGLGGGVGLGMYYYFGK